jgi:hypothetical protein
MDLLRISRGLRIRARKEPLRLRTRAQALRPYRYAAHDVIRGIPVGVNGIRPRTGERSRGDRAHAVRPNSWRGLAHGATDLERNLCFTISGARIDLLRPPTCLRSVAPNARRAMLVGANGIRPRIGERSRGNRAHAVTPLPVHRTRITL